MKRHFDIFGASTSLLPENRCVVYRTPAGVIFTYHNFSHDERNRVEIFSCVSEDKKIRHRYPRQCSLCRKHDFSQIIEEKVVDYYDNTEVQRVNATLRTR